MLAQSIRPILTAVHVPPTSRSWRAGVGQSGQLPCPLTYRLSLSCHAPKGLPVIFSTSRDTMASAETLEKSDMMSLPGDLLVDIASMLDLKEGCQMECASRRIHDVLSRPSHPWPTKRGLNLYDSRRPLSPEAFRSFAHSTGCF